MVNHPNRAKRKREITDPVERVIAGALNARQIAFEFDVRGLDFYLPTFDIYIECKQFHSARITEQMSRASNVIAIQGMGAALAFDAMLGA